MAEMKICGPNMVSFVAQGHANKWAERQSLAAGPAFEGQAEPWVCVDTRQGAGVHAHTHAPLLSNLDYIVALCPETHGRSYFQFCQVTPWQVLARWTMDSGDPATDGAVHKVTQGLVFPDSRSLATHLDSYMAMPDTEANQVHKDTIRSMVANAYKWAAQMALVSLEVGPCS